ncbi:MAG: hypothetical protein ACRD1Z_05505, partial [Vicinamibacteria bacterium]
MKVGGGLFTVLAIGIAALALVIHLGHPPTFDAPKIDLTVEVTPERVARGKVLATAICVGCHMDPVTRKLTGKHMADAPLEFGRIVSKNITRHPEKGISGWTDGELAYLLRTGVDRNGVYIPPYMSKLPHLSDEDLFSIIAFLRSDDPLVAPEAVDPPGVTEPSFLTKALTRFVFGPLPYPREPVPPPPPGDELALGRYLVVNLDCYPCHSEDFKTMNVAEPEKTPGYLGGGNPLLGLNGEALYSANLTPHEGTGLGSWAREGFLRAVREGFRPDGTPLLYPMVPLPELSETEVGAIYAYLRTVPPIDRAVPRRERPSLADTRNGEEIYRYYGCRSCHGDNGVGIADLRQATTKYPADEGLRRWIEDPSAIQPGTKMPTW